MILGPSRIGKSYLLSNVIGEIFHGMKLADNFATRTFTDPAVLRAGVWLRDEIEKDLRHFASAKGKVFTDTTAAKDIEVKNVSKREIGG